VLHCLVEHAVQTAYNEDKFHAGLPPRFHSCIGKWFCST
jgi:hypothetical protein